MTLRNCGSSYAIGKSKTFIDDIDNTKINAIFLRIDFTLQKDYSSESRIKIFLGTIFSNTYFIDEIENTAIKNGGITINEQGAYASDTTLILTLE